MISPEPSYPMYVYKYNRIYSSLLILFVSSNFFTLLLFNHHIKQIADLKDVISFLTLEISKRVIVFYDINI